MVLSSTTSLLHCPAAAKIWNKFLGIARVSLGDSGKHQKFSELMEGLLRSQAGAEDIWAAIPHAVFCAI